MKINAYRNSFHESVNAKIAEATSPGAASGTTTRASAAARVAPSTNAASSSSRGSALKKPIISHVQNGTVNVGYDSTSAARLLVAPSSASTRYSGMNSSAGGTR